MFDWTDTRIEQLKGMWQDGCSGSEIATEFGVTRSSVIAKVHRMGFALRSKGAVRGKKRKPGTHTARAERIVKKAFRVVSDVQVTDLAPEQTSPPVSLMDLNYRSCRAVVDQKDEHGLSMYCGRRTVQGHSWCPRHFRIVFTAPQACKPQPYRPGPNGERAE